MRHFSSHMHPHTAGQSLHWHLRRASWSLPAHGGQEAATPSLPPRQARQWYFQKTGKPCPSRRRCQSPPCLPECSTGYGLWPRPPDRTSQRRRWTHTLCRHVHMLRSCSCQSPDPAPSQREQSRGLRRGNPPPLFHNTLRAVWEYLPVLLPCSLLRSAWAGGFQSADQVSHRWWPHPPSLPSVLLPDESAGP